MLRFLIFSFSLSALPAAAQTCQVCGEIKAIREVSSAGRPAARPERTTVGSESDLDTGPVVGTVMQFQWGKDEAKWKFGAAGTADIQDRLGQTYYEVVVQMDGGDKRLVRRRDVSRFFVGQRVALRSGEIEPMQP